MKGVMRHEAVVVQFLEEAFGAGFFELPEMRAIRRLLDEAGRGIVFSKAVRKGVAAQMQAACRNCRGRARIAHLLEILGRLADSRASGPHHSRHRRFRHRSALAGAAADRRYLPLDQ